MDFVGIYMESMEYMDLPSGNFLHSYWKTAIELVDLPDSMVIFNSYVNYQRVYWRDMKIW